MNTQSNSMNVSCSMNIHNVYNLSSTNYNEISKKESFFALKQTLRMQDKNVIVNDFNLHHFVWKEFSYSRQHLLSNNLLIIMRIIDVTLSLFRNIVTKNYQNFKIIIDLSFATAKIVDRFIFYEIIYEVKNSFNHLFIDTIFNLKAQKKLKRRFKRNWKVLNEKKFKNIIWKHLSKSLSDESTNWQRINNYMTTFLQIFKKTMKQFTSWVKSHERAKFEWFQECIDIIKKTRRLKRECRIFDEWQTYVKICDRKNKIITQHKKNDFRAAMQISKNWFKKFFKMTKWIKDAKKKIMSQTIISSLKKREKLIIITQNKVKIMFEAHFSFSLTMFMKDVAKFDYFLSVDDEASMTRREIIKIIHKISSDKAFEINEIINKALRQLVCVIVEQIRSFFDKCIKKKI